MGMQRKAPGNTSGGAGQQGQARQSLIGTLHVSIIEYSVKYSEKTNEPYLDGKLYVAGGGDHFTFFQVFNSKGRPNFVGEFMAQYPGVQSVENGPYAVNAEGFLLAAPRQRAKQVSGDNGNTRTDYSTSLRILGTKESIDTTRDGNLKGTLQFVEDDSTYYRDAKDGKQSFAQLKTKAVSTFLKADGSQGSSEDEYVLQCFADDADRAFASLSDDQIKNGTALYVVATVKGGRLYLISVEVAKNQDIARSASEASAPIAQRPETPEPPPVKKGLGALKKPGASGAAPAAKNPWSGS